MIGSSGKHVRRRVVIVGTNFAGLTTAQHLGREHAVTVIDRTAAFEWLPYSGRPGVLQQPMRVASTVRGGV